MKNGKFGLSDEEMGMYNEIDNLVYRYTKAPFWSPLGIFWTTLIVVNIVLGIPHNQPWVSRLVEDWRTEEWGILGLTIPMSLAALVLALPIIFLHTRRRKRLRTGYYKRLVAINEAGEVDRIHERFRNADGSLERLRVVGGVFGQEELDWMTADFKNGQVYWLYQADHKNMEETFQKLARILERDQLQVEKAPA